MNDRTTRAEDNGRSGRRAHSGNRHRERRGDPVDAPREPAAIGLEADAVWNAVRSPLRLQLLEAIATRPGVTAREMATALRTSAPRLHYHLNILVKAGLVRALKRSVAASEGVASREAARRRTTGTPAPTGFEMARVPGLCADGVSHRAAFERLGQLLVELATVGIAETQSLVVREGVGRAAGFARSSREALDPREFDQVAGHLRAIDAILGRARARRRTERSLATASVFFSACLAPISTPSLPDGVIGWGDRVGPAGAVPPDARAKVRSP